MTKNFVIDTGEMAQKFVNAIEKSEKDKRNFIEKFDNLTNVRYYSDMSDKEKKEFIKKIFRK